MTRGLRWVWMLLFAATIATGCTEELLQDALGLDDQPAALAESELPNCSRVVNCCSRLGREPFTSVVPEAVNTTCTDSLGVAADTVIGQYQTQRGAVQTQSGISDDQRLTLLNDLRDQYQNRVEPGCRCFLEDTVGVIPDLAIPGDCESFTTTGNLQGVTCDDGIGAVLEAAANP